MLYFSNNEQIIQLLTYYLLISLVRKYMYRLLIEEKLVLKLLTLCASIVKNLWFLSSKNLKFIEYFIFKIPSLLMTIIKVKNTYVTSFYCFVYIFF